MEVVKATGEYSILKKRNGRYGVKTKKGKWINAEKKTEILLAEGLIKVTAPSKKEEAPAEAAEETATEEAAE